MHSFQCAMLFIVQFHKLMCIQQLALNVLNIAERVEIFFFDRFIGGFKYTMNERDIEKNKLQDDIQGVPRNIDSSEIVVNILFHELFKFFVTKEN